MKFKKKIWSRLSARETRTSEPETAYQREKIEIERVKKTCGTYKAAGSQQRFTV